MTLKKAGIRFDYCPDAVVPEIPYVQDVLYAMQLSDEQKNYDFCHGNHATYIVNVGLVIAAAGYQVLCMGLYNEVKARSIIAKTIVDLCPEEAKCFFNSAFVEAKIMAGEELPVALSADREALQKACACPEHRGVEYDPEDDMCSLV